MTKKNRIKELKLGFNMSYLPTSEFINLIDFEIFYSPIILKYSLEKYLVSVLGNVYFEIWVKIAKGMVKIGKHTDSLHLAREDNDKAILTDEIRNMKKELVKALTSKKQKL